MTEERDMTPKEVHDILYNAYRLLTAISGANTTTIPTAHLLRAGEDVYRVMKMLGRAPETEP